MRLDGFREFNLMQHDRSSSRCNVKLVNPELPGDLEEGTRSGFAMAKLQSRYPSLLSAVLNPFLPFQVLRQCSEKRLHIASAEGFVDGRHRTDVVSHGATCSPVLTFLRWGRTMRAAATQAAQYSVTSSTFLVAFELGQETWKLGFAAGFPERPWVREIAGGDTSALLEGVKRAKAHLRLRPDAQVW